MGWKEPETTVQFWETFSQGNGIPEIPTLKFPIRHIQSQLEVARTSYPRCALQCLGAARGKHDLT